MSTETNTRKNGFTEKQLESFEKCLLSVKGLSFKEAEQIIYELLYIIKNKAIINN